MNAMDLILTVTGVPVLTCTLYLLGLTLLSLKRGKPAPDAGSMLRFRIVVPAHNEEHGLGRTLWSLRRLEYPLTRYEVVVVADNCTDRTAEVARRYGATVLERHDPARRGKGYALQYAFELLRLAPVHAWDAIVVIDADTVVTPNLLQAFANRLATGAEAVQAAYLPAASAGGRLAIITEVAFTAFHVVRSTARERLGLSVGLRGNGMAFSRSLVAAVPHEAFSRTEDLEFGVRLGLKKVRVAFASEATVFGDMPEREAVASTQRRRWIGGRVEMARRHLPGLVNAAVRRRSAMLADLAMDLLVPPVSLLLLLVAVGTTAAAVTAGATGAVGTAALVWLAAAGALALHVLDAARRARRLRDLLKAPAALAAYALDKSLIVIRSFRPTDSEWIRTARTGETR